MTGATTALLCQQCTTGRVESFNINREWRPRKRVCSVWRAHSPRTGLSVRASSSVSSGTTEEEPTIDELLSKLEQGTPAPAPAAAAAAAAAQRRRPGAVGAPRARTFTVPDEELVVDKVLTGRVKAIMTFGAFIDMGARLDGLLHISKLGAGFVKNVEDVLQVGQEIQVQIIEADLLNRRIKLKRYDPNPQPEPVRTSPTGPPRERGKIAGRGAQQARRTEQPKTNYQKGQTVTGVVKNLTRRGCFVELPGGEEGFMHANEISAIGENAPIETLIKVGQEVKVRVLRIIEGRLNLSMKEELDIKKINEEMNVNMFATNAFELAFRKDPTISKYLQDSGKIPTAAAGGKTKEAEVVEAASEDPVSEATADAATEDAVKDQLASEETDKAASLDEDVQKEEEEVVAEAKVAEDEAKTAEEEAAEAKIAEEEAAEAKIAEEEDTPVDTKEEIVSADSEANEIPTASAESQQDEAVAAREETQEVVEKAETDVVREETSEAVTETVAAEAEVNKNTGNENVKEDVEVDVKGTPEVSSSSAAALAISAALVKELRQQSGAGMMDCKKALVETKGNFEQAIEYLRKKGLAGADKKASRVAAEGAIGSYIHDGRIGVLLEVNCETDFVSRGELFTLLVEDLGMQIAACQQVEYISTEEVPEEVRKKEFEIEMHREDLQNKPEAIRAKIVEGRVAKRFGELALLEQAFIKNDSIIIKDLVRQTSASVGEKIQVRRFTRYVLGEGLEKRSYDIAAEVAAQAKAQEEQQQKGKEKETKEVAVTDVAESQGAQVTISAALVKQLREETGTGMMDCKKALVECKGNFEEAKEYLRKKGLASAEKKAGRIAAEGMVVSYIHASRVGVLLELNCETDFVARNSVFKELAEDLAMQVVACPQVEYVSVDDIPSAIKDKERELEMQREDLQSKPEQIRAKIVEGRLNKLLAERALMEQAYLKDDTVLVKDLVTKTTVSLGENIRVRRFVRYNLGEGIEKKSHNLAEEIAALQST